MVELTRTRKMTIAIISIFVLILIGLLTFAMPKYYYKSDPSDMIKVVTGNEYKISPKTLAGELLKKDDNLVLVDIRSQFDFSKGNIDGSVNIPSNDILEDKYFKQFEDYKKQNKQVVLYGDDIVQANMPFMTLYPLGIDNIKLLQGGFDFFKEKTLADIANANDAFDDEASLNDINKYIAEEIKKAETVEKKVVIKAPSPAPKKVVVPVKHEAVEDEGC